ncbi:MAG: 1-deoxy-D-xylulose-5-phosphate synthase [Ruminococcaceae bacterium]|nr:1-deoxy-D-xylulose-5-phosphate synthase [Oscillospiraceae bacterium]
MLENIKNPSDVKKLSDGDTEILINEIREKIIETAAKNGGHLASNLGVVEATVAFHRVFSSPEDAIVFDVGHQCYAHKLITGRYESFSTLRTFGGLSGFTSRGESEHDLLTAGHSGSALPAALGIARAKALSGNCGYTVTVIGDGSFTNGMVYETLNNCHGEDLRLIIILNDNEMSISQNVGGMANYFTRLRNSRKYFKFKKRLQTGLNHVPLIGKGITMGAFHVKEFFKRVLLHTNMFESMGLYYMGPVDGNDEKKMEALLQEAKTKDGTTLIHMITKKGKGYIPAEDKPDIYHFAGNFDPSVGAEASYDANFSSVFGKHLCALAEENENITAITAAMDTGTGLSYFKGKYPDRFFDVGIAEECAVTFAGGLAIGGKVPVCALYSTFLQRAYDQILEDIALQGVHAVLAVDRAGLVPGDGVTHQGVFDVPLLSTVPGITLYSPETFEETERCLEKCIGGEGLCAIRYPKGGERKYDRSSFSSAGDGILATPGEECDIVFVTYSRITAEAVKASELLSQKYKTKVVKLVKLFPLDVEALLSQLRGARLVCIVEESMHRGGMGEAVCALLSGNDVSCDTLVVAVEDFLVHGELGELYSLCGFNGEQIAEKVEKKMEKMKENTAVIS